MTDGNAKPAKALIRFPKGNVPPDHARQPATLALFDAPHPTHLLSVETVPGAAVALPGELPVPPSDTVEGGTGFRIFRALPRATPPAGGWPVIWLLDGNAAFDFMTAEMLSAAPSLAVIGLGYDTDKQFARERRTRDYTPPERPGGGLWPDPQHPGRLAGGAEAFLDRLTGPLRARAEHGLPLDPSRRSLWGHSFGGLFTLYALLTRPDTFTAFAAISPSLWWGEALFQQIEADAPLPASLPRMLMALSDAEKRSGSDGPAPDGPAPATMDFAARLGRRGLSADPVIFPGLRHIDTIAASLPHALAFAARA